MPEKLIALFFGGGADSRERRHAAYIGAAAGLAVFGFIAELYFRRTAPIAIMILALLCGHTLGWLTGVIIFDRFRR